MDKNIGQRFLQAEDTLIDAMSRGDNDSLMTFESFWNSLHADYSHCLRGIAIISKCFLDFQKAREESTNQFIEGVGSILDGFGRVTISPPSTLIAQNAQPPESSLPPFIEPAYKWLLANIHNPYPSSDTKAGIVRSSRCSMNSVVAWFIGARRRIGWTTICRKHFNNCRADTADAASRALVKEDPTRVLAPVIFHDFQQMKTAAQDLYASTFTKSALAGDLDAVVKDMTEEDRLRLEREKKERARGERKRREEEKEIRRIQRALDRQVQKTHTPFASYPSPSHSRTSSPISTLEESWTDESEDEENDFIPPVLAGRKRRASVSSESTDPRQSSCADRPMKRLRLNAKVPTSFANNSTLPSPPSTSDGLDGSDEVEIIAPQPSSGSSRKRRLSDADVHTVPMRPRGLLAGPRVHAVSDPLPRASVPLQSNIDDWFQTNFFEIPGPVKNVGFDQFTPVDIEVFNGYTFPDTKIDSTEQPFQQNYTPPALVDLLSFEAKSVNLEIPSRASVPASDLGDQDNFNFFNAISTIASNCSGEAPGVSTAIDTIFQPPADLTDLVPSDPFSWTDILYSEHPFLSDINQFSLPSSCDEFSQLLPEIDLSALQLPPLYTSPQPQPPSSVDCARLAKLEQLQLLREQTRLLEQDLAVSV
ncbi:C-terminal domain of homeodomain 1-domain-containing protein [Suillus subaureus]|uniref:C-terminal domain of homeodomain 1-domain-containing protein n=1 Tax=Suillus subaureus TaxID=48587 RepID=A0A9P7E871_9AGAM|nr:C-terminal domain of homeodomain 1-domain-containing protein [Suillus subaureus]KAG1813291.1 C-terminal domain of homeodomain 1-domain-containing protein [Suillus subaureus]